MDCTATLLASGRLYNCTGHQNFLVIDRFINVANRQPIVWTTRKCMAHVHPFCNKLPSQSPPTAPTVPAPSQSPSFQQTNPHGKSTKNVPYPPNAHQDAIPFLFHYSSVPQQSHIAPQIRITESLSCPDYWVVFSFSVEYKNIWLSWSD